MTNLEHIRSMNEDELAQLLTPFDCCDCPVYRTNLCGISEKCSLCVKAWLLSEREEASENG